MKSISMRGSATLIPPLWPEALLSVDPVSAVPSFAEGG
jgi:hypothetical protein